MRPRGVLCLLSSAVLALGGCLGPLAACSGSMAPATPTRLPVEEGLAPELAVLQELGLSYWDAFNGYDVEGVLAYLEPTYRDEREATIRKEIGQVRLFHVVLGVSVETGPELTGPDEAEMYLRLKEPLGSRRIHMRFQRLEDQWLITYAQEVK